MLPLKKIDRNEAFFMVAIISAGIAPGFALLSYFYLKERFNSEAVPTLIRLFIFGSILVFPLMFIQYVLEFELAIKSAFIQSFFISALLEEFFKWFILIYLVYQHVKFEQRYDGIIYGVTISLGFATAENILYLFANGIEFALGRAILPVSSHALFGVIMGYYLGRAKFKTDKKKISFWLSLALVLPFLLHGTYDFILLSGKHWGFYMLPFMIFLWWLGLHKVKKAKKYSL